MLSFVMKKVLEDHTTNKTKKKNIFCRLLILFREFYMLDVQNSFKSFLSFSKLKTTGQTLFSCENGFKDIQQKTS